MMGSQPQSFLARISPRTRLFVVIAAVVFVLDQVTKFLAVKHLTTAFGSEAGQVGFGEQLWRFLWERHPVRVEPVVILENFWTFRYAENPGAAWSFLATAPEWFRQPFFLIVALAAMVFIVVYHQRTLPEQSWLRLALSLVFGGAVGNFVDRARLGYVIDFIDWHWYRQYTWPTFNVADSAITVGVVIMIADMLFHKSPQPAAVAETSRRVAG